VGGEGRNWENDNGEDMSHHLNKPERRWRKNETHRKIKEHDRDHHNDILSSKAYHVEDDPLALSV